MNKKDIASGDWCGVFSSFYQASYTPTIEPSPKNSYNIISLYRIFTGFLWIHQKPDPIHSYFNCEWTIE